MAPAAPAAATAPLQRTQPLQRLAAALPLPRNSSGSSKAQRGVMRTLREGQAAPRGSLRRRAVPACTPWTRAADCRRAGRSGTRRARRALLKVRGQGRGGNRLNGLFWREGKGKWGWFVCMCVRTLAAQAACHQGSLCCWYLRGRTWALFLLGTPACPQHTSAEVPLWSPSVPGHPFVEAFVEACQPHHACDCACASSKCFPVPLVTPRTGTRVSARPASVPARTQARTRTCRHMRAPALLCMRTHANVRTQRRAYAHTQNTHGWRRPCTLTRKHTGVHVE